MDSEPETEANSTPRLPLLSKPYNTNAYVQSPERSGTLTPPLQTTASVPFRWEELPGKPRFYTELLNPIDSSPKSLELPPRLLVDSGIYKLPSPTTVLEGPYMAKSKFQSSSFRITRKDWSFRKTCGAPETAQLGSFVLSKKALIREKKFLGSWRWSGKKGFKGKREVGLGGGSYVFPSSSSSNDGEGDISCIVEEYGDRKATGISRTGSFSSLSHHSRSQFWATIYEGLKQVVPWMSRKLKKDGVV